MMYAVNDPELIKAVYEQIQRVIAWREDLHKRFGHGYNDTTYTVKARETFSLLTHGCNREETDTKKLTYTTMADLRRWIKRMPSDADYITVEIYKNGFSMSTIADPFGILK